MTDTLIDAQSLSRNYQQGDETFTVVKSATFKLQAGDRIALVGRSGSGKSTLLHLMAGLDVPSGGTISWPALGARESLLPGKIALVFQAQSLLEPMTVRENVALPLMLVNSGVSSNKAIDSDKIDAQVMVALATFGLEALANKMPEELSGGQMQRVAMARAIVANPSVILADEPTGQLDQMTGHALLDALVAHLEGSRTALVVATHDPSIAAYMKHRWTIKQGVLVQTPSTLEAL
jgi:putative ABC transport system ATP-binding protein/lipoprotein-releasing system ATP-binding protein